MIVRLEWGTLESRQAIPLTTLEPTVELYWDSSPKLIPALSVHEKILLEERREGGNGRSLSTHSDYH